uniref:NADH dehydrogenase subunit 5 n=1 Tax=Ceratozetella imperatoria TaxID=3127034 RepID=UPI00315C5DCB
MYLFVFLFFLFYLFICFFFVYSFFFCSFVFDYYFFNLGVVDFSFSLVFDYVSIGFFGCISFISFTVFFYSIFYMAGTVDLRRFSILVALFVASMGLLVFSGNFLMTMVGWDGLGLISFCLVIFYVSSSSLESGLVTFFSNRVGDVFFLLGFYYFFSSGEFSWDFFSLNSSLFFLVLLFSGAITKSAQIPFSAWLPAAMAAPTPVSSLVHSSTLVTAGVYVLVRYNYLFSFFSFSIFKFFFVFTMFLAGACAFFEMDLKKVVAMSTLSQLGMMMFILSVGSWLLTFIHMIVHAFFKSMLFLSTGSLMGQMSGGQDSRFYGNNTSCVSSFCFLVSCLCLSGFPFCLGFYSKDFIITSSSYSEGLLLYSVFLGGCFFTVMYSVRLIFYSSKIMNKYNNFMNWSDSVFYYSFIGGLLLNCWLLGGGMYWLFLSKMSILFCFFDLFVGLFIMTFGFFMFFLMKSVTNLIKVLSGILSMRWLVSSGSSFSFLFMKSYQNESFWLENFGGQGVYSFLYILNKRIVFLELIGLGIFFILVFFSFFYFF